MKASLSSCLLLCLTAACQTPNGPPEWVKGGASTVYPPALFVTAIGTGSLLEEAQANAKTELSRVFSSELESVLALAESERIGAGQVHSDSELSIQTRIRTTGLFEGADIPLHWREPGGTRIWALAVLEKKSECRRIRKEARSLIEENEGDRAARGEEGEALRGLGAAMRSAARARRLDRLEAVERVLGLDCVLSRAESTSRIEQEVLARRRGLTFSLETELILTEGLPGGPKAAQLPRLEEMMATRLLDLGFRVGQEEAATLVLVAAHLRLMPADRGTPWSEVRWEGAFSLRQARNGRVVLLGGEAEGSESHPVLEMAMDRARLRGERDLSRQLDTLLRAFLKEHGAAAELNWADTAPLNRSVNEPAEVGDDGLQ